jgi:hypothetical protein
MQRGFCKTLLINYITSNKVLYTRNKKPVTPLTKAKP